MRFILHPIILVFDSTNLTSEIPWKDIASIAADIVTIIGILVGLYLGIEGFKKYLVKDIIKAKTLELYKKNKKVFKTTKIIISKISNKEDLVRMITGDDITEIKKYTSMLVNDANGASTEVHTLAFFLNETIKNITPKFSKKGYGEIRTASDFYSLIFYSCQQINYYASNIIDIPQKTTLQKYSGIKKEVQKYLPKKGYYKIKNYNYGLDTNPLSPISLIFSGIISESTSSYIFKKKYYQIIQNNVPIAFELLVNKFYFPPTIKSDEEIPLIGNRELHLVKFNVQTSFPENKEIIVFTYSNLNQTFNFVDSINEKSFFDDYKDSFISNSELFKKYSSELKKTGEESITIKCNYEDSKNYFNKVKKEFKKKLKNLKKNS